MPRYLLPLIAAAALHAGVTDFHTLSEAKTAYEKGDYAGAAEYYGELRHKNDAARYDYGNALYQQKKYTEAAEAFSGISSPALKQKALHNLGNSLANLGKTDEAIKAYEDALKLGEDKDTRYNLDLLKKQKQQQQQNKNQQNGQKQQNRQNDQNRNGQGRENQQHQDQQNGQGRSDQQQNGQNSQNRDRQQQQPNRNGENNQNREGQAQSRQEAAQKEQKQQNQNASEKAAEEQRKAQQAQQNGTEEAPGEKQNAAQAQAAMAEPISDMEERKYNKMLDKRGIKTLMIPLSGKGEPHADETTPW